MNWKDFFLGCGFMLCMIAASCGLAALLALNAPLFLAIFGLLLVIGSGLMAAKYGLPWE